MAKTIFHLMLYLQFADIIYMYVLNISIHYKVYIIINILLQHQHSGTKKTFHTCEQYQADFQD